MRDNTLSVRCLVPVPGLWECRSLLIVSFPLDLALTGLRGGGGPGSLQHELSLAARAAGGDRGAVTERPAAVLLCADADAASADLASGVLACPSCDPGRLRRGALAGRGSSAGRTVPGRGCGPRGGGAARAGRLTSCCRPGRCPGARMPPG